jgi:1,4-alpha-glucan branching enzyme
MKGATKVKNVIYDVSLLTDHDIYLFKEGNHFKLYEKLGSHQMEVNGTQGTFFAVWAPNAEAVSVIGNFNEWTPNLHPLKVREDESGIWEGFISYVGQGEIYKYHIISKYNSYKVDKADPFSFYSQVPPKTASIIWKLNYEWKDEQWMKNRYKTNGLNSPFAIYEVHLGSWRRVPEENNRFLTYQEIANYLADYVKEMGFTHVEFLPVMEHPFYGSWGYQVVGFFAPTSRYGTPQDFMHLIDCLHQHDIGVILDWVPSHFPDNEYGLVFFDGTHLYEHADPRKGFHPDWHSYIFNYGRNEVCSFLISCALFWLEKYHADGLRVDAVASMLYLDYARREGEWIPNEYGGKENLEAIGFLRRFNEVVYEKYPDIQTIAEESTAWPMVTRPTNTGGLGFGIKWNMGWMHNTLDYFSKDPIFRKYHHNQITFSIWYAFSENFLLPLSHDEVTHGKGSVFGKMPGDDWQKFANLRLLFGYMYTHPGKKLLFMGDEFGQWREWVHEESIEWHALKYPFHQGVRQWVKDLNYLYKKEPALYELDFEPNGFEWIDFTDWEKSIISFIRKARSKKDIVLAVCNFTPEPRRNYRIGVPVSGFWKEVLNSDGKEYGGSGHGNRGGLETIPIAFHGRDYSLSLTLPPLAIVIFKKDSD